jgi:hypothetical protein
VSCIAQIKAVQIMRFTRVQLCVDMCMPPDGSLLLPVTFQQPACSTTSTETKAGPSSPRSGVDSLHWAALSSVSKRYRVHFHDFRCTSQLLAYGC